MSNIIQIFQRLEQKQFQAKVFAQLDKSYTYAELTAHVQHIGGVFAANSLVEGDRIMVSSKNNYALASIMLSGLRFGITVILLDPEMGPLRAHELIELCAPKGFFLDQPLVEKWQLSEEQGFIFRLVHRAKKKGMLFKKILKSKAKEKGAKTFLEALQQYPKTAFPNRIDSATIAYILFTSGTTSTPKAVQISHQALWANLATISKVYELDEDSRIFNILTAYHTDGVIQGPVLAALNGASWYHPMEFAVDQVTRIFDAMYKYRITHFITVPTMLTFLHRLSEGFEDSFMDQGFKYVVTSAAPFELKLWEDFERTFQTKVVNVYGLTETVAAASYCGPDDSTRKPGTIGKPIDCEFKIVDEAGNELEANQIGELLIKGENILSGYLNDKEATRQAIQNGWFHTGDLAQRDEQGFYTLVGRKKNLVISGGINIQPEEVSEIINTHAAVLESVCFGIADEVFGEKLIACVALESGANFDELQLIEHCRGQLEPAKIPKEIHQVGALPKTASGKVKLEEVRKLMQQQDMASSGDHAQFTNGIFAAASIAFKVPKDKLDINTSAERLDGWDSMAHLVFVTKLESQFNIRFTSKEIMVMSSLREAEKIVLEKTK